MARKTQVIVVCDLRHSVDTEAVGTLKIAIDGEQRALDLCAEHLAEARSSFKPWLAPSKAPRRSAAKSSTPAKKRPFRNPDSAQVRAWAAENGYELPARGRIPTAVRDAFVAARG